MLDRSFFVHQTSASCMHVFFYGIIYFGEDENVHEVEKNEDDDER